MYAKLMIYLRNLDRIKYALTQFPAVALLGSRQVGKTTLAKSLIEGAKIFDLENQGVFDLISADPAFFFEQHQSPIVIDEAQLMPELFNALRGHIDKNRNKMGQYVLTGSSSPELLDKISESLAGRIALFTIEPLALTEKKQAIDSKTKNIFIELLTNFKLSQSSNIVSNLNLDHSQKSMGVLDQIFFGGYPELLKNGSIDFKNIWCENYIKTYIERDIRRLFPSLQIQTYRRFIQMLAHASGDIINQSQFASSLGVTAPTIKNYLQIAEGTFLFRELAAYSFHRSKRLIKSSKGHLRDTGLLSYMLGIGSPDNLFQHPKLGILFEIHVIEEILRQLSFTPHLYNYSYYRTSSQLEVDLVVETGGCLIPIEIKYGSNVRKEHITGLTQFMADYKSPRGLLINNSDSITELAPNIFQVPYGALK